MIVWYRATVEIMKHINIYTGEETSEYQPALFDFLTDEELGISADEIEDALPLVSDLINWIFLGCS